MCDGKGNISEQAFVLVRVFASVHRFEFNLLSGYAGKFSHSADSWLIQLDYVV